MPCSSFQRLVTWPPGVFRFAAAEVAVGSDMWLKALPSSQQLILEQFGTISQIFLKMVQKFSFGAKWRIWCKMAHLVQEWNHCHLPKLISCIAIKLKIVMVISIKIMMATPIKLKLASVIAIKLVAITIKLKLVRVTMVTAERRRESGNATPMRVSQCSSSLSYPSQLRSNVPELGFGGLEIKWKWRCSFLVSDRIFF